MKYSLVIPMYNAYGHMGGLLSYLDSQTRTDFEVLLVDDCSDDGTYEKMSAYAKTSSHKITLLQTSQNGGPGPARNLGMEKAKGEWIVFLDSDDTLVDNFFDVLDEIRKEHDPDCIIYDTTVYESNGKEKKHLNGVYGKQEGFLSIEDVIAYAIPRPCKCFRRALLENGTRFPDYRRAEDMVFYDLLFSSHPDMKIYYTKKRLYRAIQRQGSLSRGGENENLMPKVYEFLFSAIPDRYQKALQISSIRLLLYGGLLQMVLNKEKRKDIVAFIRAYEAKFPKWYRSEGYRVLGIYKKIFLTLAKCHMVFGLRLYGAYHKRVNRK